MIAPLKRGRPGVSRHLMLMLVFAGSISHAGTMTASPQAPLVNGQDIANFGVITGGDKWFVGSRAKGQTFTTGRVPVLLKSVTYFIPVGQRAQTVKTYTVRVGAVVEGDLSPMHTETFTQTVPWEGGEYMTWTFAEPVALAAQTTYAVEVKMDSSTTSWQTGIPYLSCTGNLYAGGMAFNLEEGRGKTPLTMREDKDRVFHLDLQDASATAPDPESIATVKDPALGTSPGLGMQFPRATGARRTFEDMVLSGWKKSPPGAQALERSISPFFDDRTWSIAQEFVQMQVEADRTTAFRKTFRLDAAQQARMRRARLLLAPIDDKGVVFVNGWKLGESGLNHQNSEFSLNGLLRVGDNVIVVLVTNVGPSGNMARECLIVP